MDKVVKTFKVKIKSIDETNHTVDALISDQTLDRYEDIILLSAWKKGLKSYKEHPVLLSSHNYRGLTNQIGELPKLKVTDEGLEAKIKYYVGEGNVEADWAFNLAKKGMAAFSVGFIPHKEIRAWNMDEDELKEILAENGIKLKKDQRVNTIYTEVELLENSQVTVPANPSALQKGFDEEKDEVIKDFIHQIKEMGIEKDSLVTYTTAYDYIEDLEEKSCDCDAGSCSCSDGKGLVPYHKCSINDKNDKWNSDSVEGRVRELVTDEDGDIDFDEYKKGFLCYDESKSDKITSYKSLHHDVNEKDEVITHWKGVVLAMTSLLGDKGGLDIMGSDKKKAYNHLVKHYEDFDEKAPEYKEYKDVDDVIDGCNDIFTASIILDVIYENKTSELIGEILTYVGLEESKVEERVEKITETICEKALGKITKSFEKTISKIVKDEIEVTLEVITNLLDNVDNQTRDKKDKGDDKSDTYLKEILNMTSSLKKTSV